MIHKVAYTNKGGITLKRIFTTVAVFLCAMCISTTVFAHSHLSESNPTDGDVLSEPLSEIVLEFDGDIEQGSFMDVTTTDGKDVELEEIIINESTLTGTVAEPLTNGDFQVNWNIISADGHPMEGEFSFTVDSEVPESREEVTEDPVETEETEVGDATETAEQTTDDEESSSMTTILIVILVVIVIVGFILLIKRKK
ncbi:copper resistance protein CopC [Bacilli bacterium]|nr:copper resistance protein CopC [Bacilli bacterium]PZD88188.1 copper resistance protein CopC [Bacilli bacterium]PZD91465.1 copper resistance protein CopC [Bacilli bacterium]RCO06645.1 copper resistance protein CopC [Bacilli bacterium]RCO09832.1 copper resistance protein CopC [Bacilli bacterium]